MKALRLRLADYLWWWGYQLRMADCTRVGIRYLIGCYCIYAGNLITPYGSNVAYYRQPLRWYREAKGWVNADGH